MRVRKKMPYYVIGIAALVLLSMLGPLCVLGGERSVSVLAALWEFPPEMLQECRLEDACNACGTSWMYLLLPIVVAAPSSSYLYEEIASRFCMGVEMRMGRRRYVCQGFLYSAASGGATVALGLISYFLLMACIFRPSPGYAYGAAGGLAGVALSMLPRLFYMSLYGMAMSLLCSFFVYLYPKLYFDLSVLFVVSYLLREAAMEERLLLPVSMAVALAILYGAMWRIKSRRA